MDVVSEQPISENPVSSESATDSYAREMGTAGKSAIDGYIGEVNTAALLYCQKVMLALMVVGYAGYYLCRVHLSVCTPQIIEQFHAQGVDKAFIGRFVSWGTLAYAFGKFFSGSLADFLGGKRMFLLGMLGAVLCTVLFGAGGLPLFTAAWVLNRLIQSAGWAGLVKMTSRWFSYSSYGAAMGIISLSFLFGDFVSRLFLGQLIKNGMAWEQIFYVAAAILAGIFVVSLVFIRESPQDVGQREPIANPANLFGEQASTDPTPPGIGALLLPLLRNPTFWVVCALSFGITLVRDTFGNWTPQYLHEVAHMAKGDAAQASSLFPLFGGFSVLLAGFLSDRLGQAGRALIIVVGLLLAIPALLVMGHASPGGSPALTMLMLGTVAFLLLGPYSFLAGAISLDFGGKRGSATASGWIDGVGYLGGIIAGETVGKLAEKGWSSAFDLLAFVAALSAIASGVYLFRVRAHSKSESELNLK